MNLLLLALPAMTALGSVPLPQLDAAGAALARPNLDLERTLAAGRDALSAGKFDEAQRAFEEVVTARPDDTRIWSLLARSQCGRAQTLLAEGPDSRDAAEEAIAQAEQSARKAIDCDGQSAEAWAALGHVLARAGSVEEAIAAFYQSERFAPPTVELLLDLADTLLIARQDSVLRHDDAGAEARASEADKALTQATALLALRAEVERRVAEVRTIQRLPKEALAAYRRAIILQPADTTLHEAHLTLIDRTKEYADAVSFYTGLVDVPALAHWYRGRAHELAGHADWQEKKHAEAARSYTAAEKDFVTSTKEDPGFKATIDPYLPTLRAFRGYALVRSGDFAGAEAAFLSALDLDRTHRAALDGLGELQDAMWKKYGGESAPKEQLDEMRALAAKLCIFEPAVADHWNNYGLFARELAKYEESYLAYRRALDLDPENARYLNDTALILIYHLNRDQDRARAWLEQALVLAAKGFDDPERKTELRMGDQETLGDAYHNLINMLQAQGDNETAKQLLAEFAQKLPKRTEVDFWKRKLTPEDVVEETKPDEAAKEETKDDDPSDETDDETEPEPQAEDGDGNGA